MLSVRITCEKDKQRNDKQSLHCVKLGRKRRDGSERNYYSISPKGMIKTIIIFKR